MADATQQNLRATVLQVRAALTQALAEYEPLKAQAVTQLAAADIEHVRDVVYAEDAALPPDRQTLDIYMPKSRAERSPLVLYFHGGAWAAGDKSMALFKPLAFCAAGYVFVSANYPLRPEADLRQMMKGAARAIAWVREHATEYGADPARIALMGHSAGAHVAAVLGTNTEFLHDVHLTPNDLTTVVTLDTVMYDVPKQLARGGLQAVPFAGLEPQWKSVSPMAHVKQGGRYPPFLVLISDQRAEAAEQPYPFVAALAECGTRAEAFMANGRTHAALDAQLGREGDAATERILAFLAGVATDR